MLSEPWIPIAHRGLHAEPTAGRLPRPVENTIPAFAAAIGAGVGIECDVRLTADGEAVVFHDASLDRLAGRAEHIIDCSAGDLAAVALGGDGAGIPTLGEVLAFVSGRVPLVVELKSTSKTEDGKLAMRAAEVLKAYRGTLAVKSFEPRLVRAFKALAGNTLTGLVSASPVSPATIRMAQPDFLSLSIADLEAHRARLYNMGLTFPMMAWTVTTEHDLKKTLLCGDLPVFEAIAATVVMQRWTGRQQSMAPKPPR